MEAKLKHLEMIQAVIKRMAGNSFLIRGWSVTLVSALFALAAKDAQRAFVVVSYFPCVMFWCLDAYYLSQERQFRSLYEKARQGTATELSMNARAVATDSDSWFSSLRSTTVLLFHSAIIGVISMVMWLIPAK
ncbi:MAG: hypothetical protein WCV00_05305 [Verrucomicrobiia bacterium]